MNKKEIKRANRRALPKFILVLVIAMIVGWTGGYLSGKFRMDAFAESIRNTGAFFGTHIAPWLTVAVAVIVPAICIPIYRNAKKLLGAWDGEDEDISDEIDRKLSTVIWISSASLVFSYFLIAAAYSGGFAMFESKERTIALFIAIAAFFAVMVEAVIIQQKCIDTAKQTNPEKKASVYDMRFQKSGWRTATKPKKS